MKHIEQKGSTKEAPPWHGLQKSLEDLNMFNSTNLILNSDVLINASSPCTYKSRYKKGIQQR